MANAEREEDQERLQPFSCSSEELSDARFVSREEVLKIVEKLVLDLLECVCQGKDPELSLVRQLSCSRWACS